jgi:hypothetical protein
MSSHESIGGSVEAPEEAGKELGNHKGHAGCLRWAVEVRYDASSPDDAKSSAAAIINNAVIAYNASSFQLACGGTCEAGCELVFSAKSHEPPVVEPLVTDQRITSLSACEQT